jgi:hypothetical protein
MFDELSLHILDIAMNSLAAGARTIEIRIREDRARDRFVLCMADDGRGMDRATLRRVLSRSTTSKTHRRKPVGLGLALLHQAAETCGGSLRVRSTPGRGTTVRAVMRLSHVDRPPLGDLATTLRVLRAADPRADFRLRCRSDREDFEFRSKKPAAAQVHGSRVHGSEVEKA